MTEFCAIRAKTYTFPVDDGKKIKENKKANGTKNCVIKIKNEFKMSSMLQDYKNSLFNDEIIRKSQLKFKSDCHDVYTEKINKIALGSNDDKRVQTFDKMSRYPYGMIVLRNKYVKTKWKIFAMQKKH